MNTPPPDPQQQPQQQPQHPAGPQGWVETIADVIKGLEFKDVLLLILLAAAFIPSYGAWRFIADPEFRFSIKSGIGPPRTLGACAAWDLSLGAAAPVRMILYRFRVTGSTALGLAHFSGGGIGDERIGDQEALHICSDMEGLAKVLRKAEEKTESKGSAYLPVLSSKPAKVLSYGGLEPKHVPKIIDPFGINWIQFSPPPFREKPFLHKSK